MAEERASVRGSVRQPVADAISVGFPNPYELIDVTVVLRRRNDKLPKEGRIISREEFERVTAQTRPTWNGWSSSLPSMTFP